MTGKLYSGLFTFHLRHDPFAMLYYSIKNGLVNMVGEILILVLKSWRRFFPAIEVKCLAKGG